MPMDLVLSSTLTFILFVKVVVNDLLDHTLWELLAEVLSKVVSAGLLVHTGGKPITVVPIDDFVALLVSRPFHSGLDYAFGFGFVKPSVGDGVEFSSDRHLLTDEGIIGTGRVQMLLRHDIIKGLVTTTGHAVEPATIVSVALHTADEVGDVGLLLGVVELDAEAGAGVNVLGGAKGLAEALVERVHLGLGEFKSPLDDGFGGFEVGEFGLGVFHTPLIMLKTRTLSTPVLFISKISMGGWRYV